MTNWLDEVKWDAAGLVPVPDVLEVRVALETVSVRLAAAHATPEQLAEMTRLLDLMETPGIDRERFNDHDTAFHVALAEAAGAADSSSSSGSRPTV